MRSKRLEQMCSGHPRISNFLHYMRLVNATSQTRPDELSALAKYSSGSRLALEIGSDQGVSAAVIAASIDKNGLLYCIDPWPERRNAPNPCKEIFERHTLRTGTRGRIKALIGTSRMAEAEVPNELDFIFIDGDHSRDGLAFDWYLAKQKLRQGGIVCLHDVCVPDAEPWRRPESVDYFETVIVADEEFILVEKVRSLAILHRTAVVDTTKSA
jgi:predicted O-methyltransferase YrrM